MPSHWRSDLFRLINSTPELDWLLLTKRPENIRKMLPFAIEGLPEWPWPNVWLGTTCEDQEHYDHRWPILRRIPAAIHFISYEPALGPLTLAIFALSAGLDYLRRRKRQRCSDDGPSLGRQFIG